MKTPLSVAILFSTSLCIGCGDSQKGASTSSNQAVSATNDLTTNISASKRYWDGLNSAKVLASQTDIIALSNARNAIASLEILGVDDDLVKYGNDVASLFRRIENYCGVSEPFPETGERSNPSKEIPSLKNIQDSITRKFKLENGFFFAPFSQEIEELIDTGKALRTKVAKIDSTDPGPSAGITFDYRKHHAYIGTETAPGAPPPFLSGN